MRQVSEGIPLVTQPEIDALVAGVALGICIGLLLAAILGRMVEEREGQE